MPEPENLEGKSIGIREKDENRCLSRRIWKGKSIGIREKDENRCLGWRIWKGKASESRKKVKIDA